LVVDDRRGVHGGGHFYVLPGGVGRARRGVVPSDRLAPRVALHPRQLGRVRRTLVDEHAVEPALLHLGTDLLRIGRRIGPDLVRTRGLGAVDRERAGEAVLPHATPDRIVAHG